MSYKDFIYTALRREYESDIREGVGISQIGYCELKTQRFFIEGKKPDIPVDRLLAMRIGTVTHAEIFRLLWKFRGELDKFTYKKKEMEVVLPTPAGSIKGHLDLLAEVNGEMEVADFKVVDFGAFGYIHNEKSRQHEYDQINCYAVAAGIKRCRLTYVCKGGKTTTAEVKEFPFAVDLPRVDELKLKYDRIMAGKAEKPFDNPADSWECNVCSYYTSCWGARTFTQKQDGVVVIPKELEEEYIREDAVAKEHKARADEVKEKIAAILGGKRGEGDMLSAYYSAPRAYDKYDSKLLKQYVAADILDKCSKKVENDGYYRMNVRG
jgi:hypothetical protein